MSMPKVSVIVPCYNTERYLDRCVCSLSEQTQPDIEIILVDDGSPGRIPEMCDEWAERDTRIKVIHKKNGGLGHARNSGLEVAKGEYVAFVDSDDYIDADAYRAAYEEAGRGGSADAVFFGTFLEGMPMRKKQWAIDSRKQWTGPSVRELLLDGIACAPYEKQEVKYGGVSVWHAIYRRSVIETFSLRFLSEREIVNEDILWNVDFLRRSDNVVYMPDCYYHYCFNGVSLSNTFFPEKYGRFRRLYHILLERDSEPAYVQRVDRLFIDNVRMLILSLMASDMPHKIGLLRKFLDDDLWQTLRVRYKPAWLPPYQNIVLRLIYGNHPYLLYGWARLANLAKRILMG